MFGLRETFEVDFRLKTMEWTLIILRKYVGILTSLVKVE